MYKIFGAVGSIKNSDIFLMTSLFENSPYTLLEAMSAKLPVVGTDTGGVNEIITHKENGLLFKIDNVQELCYQLKELANTPELLQRLSENAFKFVSQNYNPKTIARETLDFYKTVVQK